MSALSSVIFWFDFESDFTFRANETPEKAFNRMSKIFERDGRSPLANILRDDMGAFFEYIEAGISRAQQIPEVESEFEGAIRGSKSAERQLKGFFKSLKGLLRF